MEYEINFIDRGQVRQYYVNLTTNNGKLKVTKITATKVGFGENITIPNDDIRVSSLEERAE